MDLHAYVWLRFDGSVEGEELDTEALEVKTHEDGTRTRIYQFRRIRETAEGQLISQYIRTTPGRIIYNKTIQEALAG